MKALLRRFRPTHADSLGCAASSTSRTHLGRVRKVNEDRVLDRTDLGLWAVADGMGGHSRGDLAAQGVIAHLSALAAPVAADAVARALAKANREIHSLSGGNSGTTLVMATIDRCVATIRWIGDSRAYLLRDGGAQLLTRDHSLVQQLVESGLVQPEQAAGHPQANVITRALGISSEADVECLSVALKVADRLLLCSDGLSRSFDERDVREPCTLAAMADRLLAAALERDGSDNISLVLVEVS